MSVLPITMPKWGLAMQEGTLAKWSVEEGALVKAGQEIADIETTKIANTFESPVAGILRKKIVPEGSVVAVGALLAVIADSGTSEAEIDDFVSAFLANFKSEGSAAEKAPEAQSVEVGSRRLRYLRIGPEDGRASVLIHGFGADLGGWMFNHATLAEDRPVYAVDLPGHGGSAKDVGDGTPDQLAGILDAWLETIGVHQAHLVGHSLGGTLASLIATTSPDRVASLSLIAPAGLGAEISSEFLDGFISETRARKLRPVVEKLVANPSLVSAEMVEDVLKFKRLDGATEALRRIADSIAANGRQLISVRDRLAALSIPIQVIWGDQDRILPVQHCQGLAERIEVMRFADAGHLPHMEKAAEVNAALRKFVTQVAE
jgi:pyruvate dehydrogenase E2 component (dihydrolipoamide acetyltransferase)